MAAESNSAPPVIEWLSDLTCVQCGAALTGDGMMLTCTVCQQTYPVTGGTLRALGGSVPLEDTDTRERTARSFAFEWQRFGAVRSEWERNFADYMHPHGPGFFDGVKLLDAGTGSGRHARQAALYGARVAAVDLGESIDVARQNVPDEVLTVQADLERLPFKPGSFDFVMSIGVLHHLPNPEGALRRLTGFARPGGRVRVYLYWQPEIRWHRWVLRGVAAARRLTTALPHRVLEALCYPLAAALWAGVVLPYRGARKSDRLRPLAATLPLKAYADYPFGVLVNDTFDRLSAPIENRYTAAEVERMMRDAGLTDVFVTPNAGWVAEGLVPQP